MSAIPHHDPDRNPNDILTPADVVREYSFLAGSVHTLENWRALKPKKGPDYIVGRGGRIFYRRSAIEAEIEHRTVRTGGRS